METLSQKNEIHLDFCVRDFDDIDHNRLTQLIGIEPTKIGVKGDKRNPNNENSPLIQSNSWFLSSGIDKYSDFDEHMDALLSVLAAKIEILKPICSKYQCEFVCAFYVYRDNAESTPWVNLNERYNQLVSVLNITFDLDLYVF